MATEPQFQQPPQQTETAESGQNVAQTTVQNNHDDKVRSIPAVQYFSVATIIIAFLWCIMGIIAIVVEAKDSYVGDPIWSGALFLLPTGYLGLRTYWNPKSIRIKRIYLFMSIVSSVVCAHLLIYMSFNIVREEHTRRFYYGLRCFPLPGFDYDWDYDYYEECKFKLGGRIAVDAIICLLAFVQLVLTTVSLGFTCYGTFKCCYNCCRSAPRSDMMQYTAGNGTLQMIPVAGHGRYAGYQPVSIMMVQQAPTAGQGGQSVSPVMNVPGQHTQPMYIPAGSPPAVIMQQQPVNVAPPSYGSPAMAATAASGDGTPFFASEEKQPLSGINQPNLVVLFNETPSGDDDKNKIEHV